MKEDIEILEAYLKELNLPELEELLAKDEIIKMIDYKEIQAIENLLTRYKDLDSLLAEIDNKEVSDALHMLLHCSLKDTEYKTQKSQFKIVNAYIKQLEKENGALRERVKELEEENKKFRNGEIVTPKLATETRRKIFNDFQNYISKSKVKEKIEELNDYDSKFCQRVLDHNEHTLTELIQNILQELLEE